MKNRLLERIHPTELKEARAVAEAKPLPAAPAPKRPGWGRDMVTYLRAQDRSVVRDPFRYDPNRLLPASARVRQVRVDSVPMEAPQSVAQLCASAGLVYAKRHVAAELAPVVALLGEGAPDTGWGVHAKQLGGAL